jgi:hypothetical protein
MRVCDIMDEGQIKSQAGWRDQEALFADAHIAAKLNCSITGSKQCDARVLDVTRARAIEAKLRDRAGNYVPFTVRRITDQVDIDIGATYLKVKTINLSLDHAAGLETIVAGAFIFGRNPATDAQYKAVPFGCRRALRCLCERGRSRKRERATSETGEDRHCRTPWRQVCFTPICFTPVYSNRSLNAAWQFALGAGL